MTVLLRAAKLTRRHAARLQDQMTEHHVIADWHLDKRVPIALIFAIAVQTGAGLIWAGAASERISQLEAQGELTAGMTERLVRVEEQIGFARESLDRIERKLDRDTSQDGDD